MPSVPLRSAVGSGRRYSIWNTLCAIQGKSSTGIRSIAFIITIHRNTVSASGAMNVRSPWTIDLLCSSTSSTSDSTAAWNRPGTPEVTLRATSHSTSSTEQSTSTEKKIVSTLKTEKSTMNFCFSPVDVRCVRWWTMYSVAVGAWPEAAMVENPSLFDQQRQYVALQHGDDGHQHRQPDQVLV